MTAREEAKRQGLLLDLPLCRYSWCLLPHHQIAMSVWQPQYTLMFNKILDSGPPPHYYLHVLQPGGAESLASSIFSSTPRSGRASVGGDADDAVVAARRPVPSPPLGAPHPSFRRVARCRARSARCSSGALLAQAPIVI